VKRADRAAQSVGREACASSRAWTRALVFTLPRELALRAAPGLSASRGPARGSVGSALAVGEAPRLESHVEGDLVVIFSPLIVLLSAFIRPSDVCSIAAPTRIPRCEPLHRPVASLPTYPPVL